MGIAPKPEQREEEGDVDGGCGEGGSGGGKGASEAAEGESKVSKREEGSEGAGMSEQEEGESSMNSQSGAEGSEGGARREARARGGCGGDGMGAEHERGAREGWEGARGSGRLGAGEAQGGGREVPWACKVEAREVREREGVSAEHKREAREHKGGCGRVCESGRGRGRGSGRQRGLETGKGEGERERDVDQDGSDNDGGGDVEAGERVREEVREEEGHRLKGVGKGAQGGTTPREGKRVGVGGRGRESGEGEGEAKREVEEAAEGEQEEGVGGRRQGELLQLNKFENNIQQPLVVRRDPISMGARPGARERETKTKTKTERAQGWNVEWLKREGSDINGGLRNGGVKGCGIEQGEEVGSQNSGRGGLHRGSSMGLSDRGQMVGTVIEVIANEPVTDTDSQSSSSSPDKSSTDLLELSH
ncbi:hypothetical protein V8E53_008563 [Lactarius tabidus]